jgi:predicted ATP-grasp superfamily ATP-dependent carboligase
MRVLVYEFITAGGNLTGALGSPGQAIGELTQATQAEGLASLLTEGRAMVTALVADLVRVPEVEVTVLVQDALAEEFASLWPPQVRVLSVSNAFASEATMRAEAPGHDFTIAIAPETDDCLFRTACMIRDCGGRLLGPGPETIRLTSDKHALAEHLRTAGVAAPEGLLLAAGTRLPSLSGPPFEKRLPQCGLLVWKPLDGCGSQGLRLVPTTTIQHESGMPIDVLPRNDAFPLPCALGEGAWITPVAGRLERYLPGFACSVTVLCGPAGNLALPACAQVIEHEFETTCTELINDSSENSGGWRYCGGWLPLPPELAERARGLAMRAVATLPDLLGFVGVDLVLGEQSETQKPSHLVEQGLKIPTGSLTDPKAKCRDTVIEINPRFTTSYVGLRKAAKSNLAAALLDTASGVPVELAFRQERIAFRADGRTTIFEPTVDIPQVWREFFGPIV